MFDIKLLDILLQWIAHLLDMLSIGPFSFSLKKVVVSELPDDVIVDILSRLPAECVLDFQRVCRRWRSLTLSEHFIKLHLSRATPAIFIYAMDHVSKGKRDLGFFVCDPTIAKRKKTTKLRLRPEIVMNLDFTYLVGSCGGLLLFSDLRRCNVFNPVRQEQIAIDCPNPGYICGLYSHPLTNEFRILYLHYYPGNVSKQYFVYTLGGSIWRKINTPPFHYAPSNTSPAICNGALHWIRRWYEDDPKDIPPCSCGVMVFSIDKEDFFTLPHPGNECHHRGNHKNMCLFAANEVLSFCLLDECREFNDIWILEDYATWVWVRKWKLSLNFVRQTLGMKYDRYLGNVELVHIQDGQVLLLCNGKGLFLYQLDHNTVTKLEGPPLFDSCVTRTRCTSFRRSVVCLHQLSPLRIKG